jgi:hypothetical protein
MNRSSQAASSPVAVAGWQPQRVRSTTIESQVSGRPCPVKASVRTMVAAAVSYIASKATVSRWNPRLSRDMTNYPLAKCDTAMMAGSVSGAPAPHERTEKLSSSQPKDFQ